MYFRKTKSNLTLWPQSNNGYRHGDEKEKQSSKRFLAEHFGRNAKEITIGTVERMSVDGISWVLCQKYLFPNNK